MLKEGQKAPDFELDAMDGERRKLSEILKKGPALIAFFKSSCPVCQYAFPFLERLHASGNGVTFFAVSQDGEAATGTFLKDQGVTFPTLLDAQANRYPVSNAYKIRSVPSAFLVEPDGSISLTMEGFEKTALEQLGERVGTVPFRPGESIPDFRPG